MTAKRILAIIIALKITISFSGYGINPFNSTYTDNSKSLIQIFSENISDSSYKQFVMYDPETSVMYMYSWDYISGGSTVTAMYNADGSLRTYDASTKINSLVMVSSGDISSSRYKQFVMYDPETLVMYMYSCNYISGSSTVTAMYNADGSLRTYDTSTEISSLIMVSFGDISASRYKQFVMYDPETSVMYMYSWDYISGGSTVTTMYNADNSLKSIE